ncbi:MAG: TerD family protein [Clostridia bacterium]|nr:TerD family protein [Clostridia bacterium]
MNRIYLRRKTKILISPGSGKTPNTEHVATILKNLEPLGYTLSKEIIDILHTYTVDELKNFYLGLVKKIKKMIGAHVEYKPMYPNFPIQVMQMAESKLYLNAIIHYLSFGSMLPVYEKEERLPLFAATKLKVINLGNQDDFNNIFYNLMASKTSIADTDKMDMEWFIKNYKNVLDYLPDEIPLKENVCLICSWIMKYWGADTLVISKYINTATDVLRLAVSMSDGDVSLAANTKFRSFTRNERRILLGLLENCSNIEEDMLRYKNRWIRLGERLHPSEYKTYLKAQAAFRKLRNNEKIETYNSRLSTAIESQDLTCVLALMKQRPGEFARKLDHILRLFEDWKLIIKAFEEIAIQVPTPLLLQVREHFKKRNEKQELRAFFPKGSIAKVYGIENQLPSINKQVCEEIVDICEQSLIKIFGAYESLGKVYIDERLKDYIVPFSQRSASKALKTYIRGTRINIPADIKTIRSFIYWKEHEGDRTDLDLSAVLYDQNWNYVEHISYTNLRSSKYKAAHSGDITAAPLGASEFIDLDIESIKRYSGRYVVLAVNSFTGQKFAHLPECFMGWMARECPASGEIYEPKTVENKIDISSESTICIPMVLDIHENKVIWADIALKSQPTWNNVENNKKGMILMGKALTTLTKPNLYDLFMLHAQARGELCNHAEEANTVFAIDKGITPYDNEIIMAQYL